MSEEYISKTAVCADCNVATSTVQKQMGKNRGKIDRRYSAMERAAGVS
jgi:hypothetical protein